MGTTVQYHVGEEFMLVDLTSFCTGNSDAYWDFIFDKIWQIIIGTITGSRFFRKIPGGIGPCHSGIDEENIHRVPFSMGDFGKLKTGGRFFIVILAQGEQEKFAIFDLLSLSLLDFKVETPQHFASGCCDIDPPSAFVALV